MSITKILAVVVLSSMLALSSAAAQGKTWDTVQIATEGAIRPGISWPDGSLDGFDADITVGQGGGTTRLGRDNHNIGTRFQVDGQHGVSSG